MTRVKFILWYITTLILSLFANIIIKWVPFKTFIQWITNGEEVCLDESVITLDQQKRLYRLEELLDRIRRRVPWRVYCFEQAIVALIIARVLKINMSIYFGIQKKEDIILAHAWTEVGKQIVTGGEERKNFVSVYSRGYSVGRHKEENKENKENKKRSSN